MLERETDLIIQLLTERTIGQKESITLKDLLGTAVPKNIKRYVQCEVIGWLLTDFRSAPALSHISGQSRTSRVIVESMVQPLAMEYVFTRTEFLSTLENGVHFLENYLCRPHWTLEEFVFDRQDRVSADLLATKLTYLTDYAYLCDLIAAAVRRKGWKDIQRSDFRALVARIDQEVTKNHSARELTQLVKPIYDFLFLEDARPDRAIPCKALLVFFQDKDLKGPKELLERRIQMHAEISLSELGKIMAETASGDSSPAPETNPATVESTDPPNSIPGEQVDSADTVVEGSATEIPEPTVPSPGPPPDGTTDIQQQPRQNPESAFSPSRPMANPVLSLTFAGLKETRQNRILPEISTLISQDQRDRFLKAVFKKDDAYFSGVMTALNKTHSWKEASLYLNQLYEINSLDPYADVVVEFTNVIHRRYESSGNHPE